MSPIGENISFVRSETPIKDIWARLSYFESEHNAKEFLKAKFALIDKDLKDIASGLAFTMRAAREYYDSGGHVSLLTRPLLIFYGMTALSKVLFMSTYGKKSPSKGHGLEPPKPTAFDELSTRVRKVGTFPLLHCCLSKEKLYRKKFIMKELLSIVPEVKVEYETIYKEKSRALRVSKIRQGFQVVDSEIEEYGDLVKDLKRFFPEIKTAQKIGTGVTIYDHHIPLTWTVSGKYLVLPMRKQKDPFIPELSAHFLIMYILGMISRYNPKEWGEIATGEESGDIYIIQKFLEATTRKFPNLILNKLRNRFFVFISPQLEAEEQGFTREQMKTIYDRVNRRFADELRRRGLQALPWQEHQETCPSRNR